MATTHARAASMRRGASVAGMLVLLLGVSIPAVSPAEDPIKIGVIGEGSSVAGASISKAAEMAAEDVNAHGGVNGRQIEVIIYDDHSSAADAVRAFQRAATEDKVAAVVGSSISEIALAIEQARIVWAGEPAKFAADMGEGYL